MRSLFPTRSVLVLAFSMMAVFARAADPVSGGNSTSSAASASSTSATVARTAVRAQHVFIISFDQGSPDGISRADMPLFKKMAAEGAHTWEASTIVPSLTLPSHVSMLTGVGIQKHQISWNDWDPKKPGLKVPTIFNLAKKQGLTTAMVAAKEKFKTLEQAGDIDSFVIPTDYKSKGITEAVVSLLKKEQPNLVFIHFGDPDFTGHQFGIHSKEKMTAFNECDQALKVIRDSIKAAGIEDSSVIIMTADHGCHDRPPEEMEERAKRKQTYQLGTHGSSSTEDVTIPWVAYGKGVKRSFTITAAVVQYDTAATALWLLGVPLPESFWGRPVVSAFE